MIICLATGKGGTGKTTATAAIAYELAARGGQVMAFDIDRQKTLESWYRRAKPAGITVKGLIGDQFMSEYKALAGQPFDHLLIDTAGVLDAATMRIFGAAELVIIPCALSQPDLKEALDMAEVATRLKQPFKLLITRVPVKPTHVSRYVLSEIVKSKLPRFKQMVTERTAYKEIFVTGKGPNVGKTKAGAEIVALVDEIEATIKANKKRKVAA